LLLLLLLLLLLCPADFFRGKPGSVLALYHTQRVRPACTSASISTELIMTSYARSRRFPNEGMRQHVRSINTTFQVIGRGDGEPPSLLDASLPQLAERNNMHSSSSSSRGGACACRNSSRRLWSILWCCLLPSQQAWLRLTQLLLLPGM
jgi:hypothetical protein